MSFLLYPAEKVIAMIGAKSLAKTKIFMKDADVYLETAGIPVGIRSPQGFLFLCHNGSICHCRK